MIEFDGGFQQARADAKRPNDGDGRPNNQCPRRPRPGFHFKREKLIDRNQHQGRRERVAPAPTEQVQKPLDDQPPTCAADLDKDRVHFRASAKWPAPVNIESVPPFKWYYIVCRGIAELCPAAS